VHVASGTTVGDAVYVHDELHSGPTHLQPDGRSGRCRAAPETPRAPLHIDVDAKVFNHGQQLVTVIGVKKATVAGQQLKPDGTRAFKQVTLEPGGEQKPLEFTLGPVESAPLEGCGAREKPGGGKLDPNSRRMAMDHPPFRAGSNMEAGRHQTTRPRRPPCSRLPGKGTSGQRPCAPSAPAK
jgi:hypothetical protein